MIIEPVDRPPVTQYEVLGALLQAVTERGRDYVYPGLTCRYRWTQADEESGHGKAGEAACLAGRALEILGLLDQLVPASTPYLQTTKIGLVCDRYTDEDHHLVSEPAVRVLRAAQAAQDSGQTWGKALDQAVEAVLHS